MWVQVLHSLLQLLQLVLGLPASGSQGLGAAAYSWHASNILVGPVPQRCPGTSAAGGFVGLHRHARQLAKGSRGSLYCMACDWGLSLKLLELTYSPAHGQHTCCWALRTGRGQSRPLREPAHPGQQGPCPAAAGPWCPASCSARGHSLQRLAQSRPSACMRYSA